MRPYQQRWVDDHARFKIVVKSARTGFSFATAYEAVEDCLAHPNTTWIVLSASQAQSDEFIEQGVRTILEAMQEVCTVTSEPFVDALGTAKDITVRRANIPNGSRVIALPANPRTARGFPGNMILDEFGHHEKSYAIWAAASRQVALGHKLRILSTPNGEQGKFFDLAKEFKLTDQIPPDPNPKREGTWSCHFVNVDMAIAEGCPINKAELHDLYKGDPATEDQEFNCAFLKGGEAWITLELIARAEDDGAWMEMPSKFVPVGPLYLGIDVARDGDRTVAWLFEKIGDVMWTRHVLRLHNVPFFAPSGSGQLDQATILLPLVQLATRTAMDKTGIGWGLFEYLASKVSGRVMGVNFAGTVKKEKAKEQSVGADTLKIKTDMAVRLKEFFERARIRIPYDEQIRQDLQSIKREYSGGAVTFNAPRIEIEGPTAGGKKKKVFMHADAFWSAAMGLLAASGAEISTECAVAQRSIGSEMLGREHAAGVSAASLAGGY